MLAGSAPFHLARLFLVLLAANCWHSSKLTMLPAQPPGAPVTRASCLAAAATWAGSIVFLGAGVVATVVHVVHGLQKQEIRTFVVAGTVHRLASTMVDASVSAATGLYCQLAP